MDHFAEPPASATDRRGQTETLGVVLLLSITIIGAMAVVAFGAASLEDARGASGHESVGHAMTQFDSKAAVVGLGETSTQSVRFGGTGSGSYTVEPDAGWMNISHVNESAGDYETFLNTSLGALVYEDGDVEIAYQGGGVWRKQGDGSVMISPPEFHYRDATLTLPIINVNGSASASGSVRASITNEMSARAVFPNSSDSYPDGTVYYNPVTEDNVTVTVHSEYYEAWATYFRSRTSGTVDVHDSNNTVKVTLIAQGITGDFDMPSNGNSINIRGMGEGHPFDDFTITVYPDDTDTAEFSNLQWTLYAEEGSQQFEIHLRQSGKNSTAGTGCKEVDVAATVFYSDENGDPYHGWYDEKAFKSECYDGTGNGQTNETRLVANLTGETQLGITDLSSSNTGYFDPNGASNLSSMTFHQHEDENVHWESKKFNSSDPDTTIGNLTNHYLSLMGPDVELTVKDKSGGTVNEEASAGTLDYESGSSSFITFLHVTENRIRVEFD